MDPAVIALLAVVASALQVALLRVIDYYYPRGHTKVGDHIAETKAERITRHEKNDKARRKEKDVQDDDYEVVDGDDSS